MKEKENTIKLVELANLLPVGIPSPDGTGWERVFEFKPWTMKDERTIGKMRNDAQGGSRSSFVSRVICHMLSKLGSINFANSDEATKLLYLSKLTFGDFLYLFCYLRKEAIGNIIPFEIYCPACSNSFEFPADLDTLTVSSPHIPEEASHDCLQTTVTTKDGITYQGSTYKDVIIRSTLWATFMDQDPEDLNEGLLKEILLSGAIVGLSDYQMPDNVPEGTPFLLDQDSLDDMTKRDIQFLADKLSDITYGPELILEGKCVKCRRPFRQRLDWDYELFFESSSQ